LKDKSLAHRTIKGEPSPKVIGSYLSYLWFNKQLSKLLEK
jgi:hypothetical protein